MAKKKVKKQKSGLKIETKNLNLGDISLIKFSVFFFTLALLTLFPQLLLLMLRVMITGCGFCQSCGNSLE